MIDLPRVKDDEVPATGGEKVALTFYDAEAQLPRWDADSPVWPIIVNQRFGRYHTGIDLDCRFREPIYAAQEGVVVFTGWYGGYGLMVKIKHTGKFQTVYGHNSQVFVKSGQRVSKGQTIASCGSTGRSTGTHSHFEILYDNQWINPGGYILP